MLVTYQPGFILSFNTTRNPAPASCSLCNIWTHFDGHRHVSAVLFAHCNTEGVYLFLPGVLEGILSLNNTGAGGLSFLMPTFVEDLLVNAHHTLFKDLLLPFHDLALTAVARSRDISSESLGSTKLPSLYARFPVLLRCGSEE
jgi:hypothetical protein